MILIDSLGGGVGGSAVDKGIYKIIIFPSCVGINDLALQSVTCSRKQYLSQHFISKELLIK